jgi:predicted nucleic acid-binding protein
MAEATPLRVYVDTSVFGGAFDYEFAMPSLLFFDQVREGRFQLITSPVVRREVMIAPAKVADLFIELVEVDQVIDVTPAALALHQAYLQANIVGERWSDDALHVAVATVADCAVIVSWNFKHIVHRQKIPRYNTINTRLGYKEIGIYSPSEVIEYDEEVD